MGLHEAPCIIDNDVSIRSAIAKTIDRGSTDVVRRPCKRLCRECQIPFVGLDERIWLLKVGIWWDNTALERENSLYEPSNASTAFDMADVAFNRPNE